MEKDIAKARGLFYGLFFICGLALTNHHTIILLSPAVLYFLWVYSRTNLFKPIICLRALALFFLGLSVYCYVPIRAHFNPPINWDDAKNVQNFIRLVTRADYGRFNLISVLGSTYSVLVKYALYGFSLIRQFGVGVILALLGLVYLIKTRQTKLCLGLVIVFRRCQTHLAKRSLHVDS